VRTDPAATPFDQLIFDAAPRRDTALHSLGSSCESVLAAFVSLDQTARQKPRQLDPNAVPRHVEELPGGNQRAHRHGGAAYGGKEIENQALGGRAHGLDITD
jgi:hypothetical protein